MTYDVVLERTDTGFVATLPAFPDLRVAAATREGALAAVRGAVLERQPKIEIVSIEVPDAPGKGPYPPDGMALAARAARLRGEPGAPVTGKPWVHFAGFLADVSPEDQAICEAEIARAREEQDRIGVPE